MYAPLRWALRDLRSFCQLDEQQRATYLTDPARDFSRKRKLTFDRTIGLILGLLKKVYP